MVRALGKYVQFLFLLLLAGQGVASAHIHLNPARHKSEKHPEAVIFNDIFQRHTIIQAGFRSDNKSHDGSYTEEKEEEIYKPGFAKTYTYPCNDLFSSFNQSPVFLFTQVKGIFSLVAHWFYTSSRRYLMLRVLRI